MAQAIISLFESAATAQPGVGSEQVWRAALEDACRELPGITVLDIQVRKDRFTDEGVVVSVPAVSERPGLRTAFLGRQATQVAAALKQYLVSARRKQ